MRPYERHLNTNAIAPLRQRTVGLERY